MADKDFKVKAGLDLGTPLPLTEGGTGQTSANNALNAILPVQTSQANKFLQTDGTNTTWTTAAVANNATFTGSSIVIPSGTTAERPASPVTGAIRLNTDQGTLEFWTGTSWGAIATFPQPPRNLVATDTGTSRAYNNASASIAFDLPTGNGGSTITSYKITSNPGGFYVTGSSSPLVVTGLQSNTSYTFTGTATNTIGEGASSVASSAITATTIPQISTIGTATNVGTSRAYNDAAADISFTAGGTGGKTVTYTATSSPGGFTGTSSSSPVRVTGLLSNTSYSFTIVPSNANGSAAATSASNSITVTTVPQAPTIGSVTGVSSGGAIDVAFTAPANTGGSAITSYTVTSSPGSITGTGASSPIRVSGLTNGTAYTFTVTAQNINGSSAASSASSSITPTVAYSLAQTYNASTTYTVPSGITKIAVFATAGGGGGGNTGSPGFGAGSAGGGSGAAGGFTDYTVSSGQTFTVTVGSGGGGGAANAGNGGTAGGATSFGDLLTANGGNACTGGGGSSPGNGGTASSNASGAVTSSGASGGNSGSATYTGVGNAHNGNSGAGGGSSSPITLTLTGLGSVSYQRGGGGGGGACGSLKDSNVNVTSGSGGGGGSPYGASGGNSGSARTSNTANGVWGYPGGSNGPGGGGGGGGAVSTSAGASNNSSGYPSHGSSGYQGQVLVYEKA